jgi:hypothetical protein
MGSVRAGNKKPASHRETGLAAGHLVAASGGRILTGILA